MFAKLMFIWLFNFIRICSYKLLRSFFIGNTIHLRLQMLQGVPMPHFQLFLFVCSLFFALNRKASSSLVFILTIYFSFYDLQLFILVQSLISSNWLTPATSISKLWAFVAGQKIYFIYRISYLILTLGALVNIWTKLEWRTKEAKRLAVYSEKGRVEKKKKEAEKRNISIGTHSDS